MTTLAESYMEKAIALAREGLGRTAPNPPVGAVVVRDGVVVGKGFHPEAGQPHAEVFALRDAGDLACGADLYVTLEPCCHHGRTGPCTDEIIAAGVSRVFVGTQDPNPKVAGRGLKQLRSAGIEVSCNVLGAECGELIAPFAKHMKTGLPYVVFKSAMTLDGQTATIEGDSKWISSEASRELVHQLRNQVDAIMVGSGTVIADNPRLNTRLAGPGRDPVRVVFDGRLETSPDALVYSQSSSAQAVLITSSEHSVAALQPYRARGVDVVAVRQTGHGLDLTAALMDLGKMNLQHILLEGGSVLAGAMMRAGLVDRVMIFVAPKILGGVGRGLFSGEGVASISEALPLVNLRARQVGADILLEGEVQHVHRSD